MTLICKAGVPQVELRNLLYGTEIQPLVQSKPSRASTQHR